MPESRKVRYLIHSDCKNEPDDQYTVAHTLMCDRLVVHGALAGRFDAAPGSREIRVYDELDVRLDLEDLFAKLQINFPTQDA